LTWNEYIGFKIHYIEPNIEYLFYNLRSCSDVLILKHIVKRSFFEISSVIKRNENGQIRSKVSILFLQWQNKIIKSMDSITNLYFTYIYCSSKFGVFCQRLLFFFHVNGDNWKQDFYISYEQLIIRTFAQMMNSFFFYFIVDLNSSNIDMHLFIFKR